jgi:hypothetical protein
MEHTSGDRGAHEAHPVRRPLPGTHYGGFAGDYVGAAATPGGNAVAVLPLGLPATTQKFNEPMEAVKGGEPITRGR